ncbi:MULTISPECIES: hypothetical protein [unclassified Chelatococcus]|uniref:hypothetical protein n=1 Tax=unclassified Chelatococcus TaxID=2638111 RepID=UPI001BCB0D84|nr:MULTISPECIES: hypothetical protein [unclassified Chelatococcus]CAH1648715.1 M24 family metallopeptidase [Hyphomicrobiales bacterium]MBS7741880.1 hypothetical protein [Chelatococcus sp. HY11]MBX3541322.1 hypothetical protein [Chelatococcus sp.]MCO5074785.1 hypothetical protein [Chelatococcus sp.]CAH1691334.1 M24 family metallopeptidase [Hyphomicrobiales bacterium]
MKSRVYIGRDRISNMLGRNFWNELTFPKIFKDSADSIGPVLIERDGNPSMVIGAFDAAAFQSATKAIPFETYASYFSWNHPKGYRPQSFTEAVRRLAGDDLLEIDADMPIGRFEALAQSGPAAIADPTALHQPKGPCFLYRKRRQDIEAQWCATRDADVPALTPFVSSLRFGPELLHGMSSEPLGFAVLDRICRESGLASIYVSAPFNVEMFTGLPSSVAERYGITALYTPGSDAILILSPQSIERPDFAAAGHAPSLMAALSDSRNDKLGIEREHLAVAIGRSLSDDGFTLADATYALRRWQDERAGTDLLYFITAANAVLHGIEHASQFMNRRLAGGLTENEVAAVYHQGVQNFATLVGMDGRVHPYFDIIHSGERTLLPAIAGDYPLNSTDRTIKFDMGLLVTDAYGCVRGCSDIARSVSPDADLQAAHDELRRLLVDELIPSIQSGMSGGEIHANGVEILRPMTTSLKQVGLLHEGMTMDGYTRDCGHTLQRQTLATVHFLPDFKERLHTGMLGCTEFVWPIDDKIIAAEDGYYVTEKGAVPFTI